MGIPQINMHGEQNDLTKHRKYTFCFWAKSICIRDFSFYKTVFEREETAISQGYDKMTIIK